MTNQPRIAKFLNNSRGVGIVLSLSLATAFIYLFSFTSNAAVGQGRIAYWKLDETSGSTYADYDGALDGACAGACPTATTGGQVNGAQVFDGSSAGITVTADSIMDWGVNDSLSIELWVKGDPGQSCATVDEILVGRADSGAGTGYWALGCTAGTGTANFQLRDSNNVNVTLQSSRVITDGLWHHIVGTRDGANDINYLTVDGTDVVSVTQNYTGGLVPSSAVLSLGHLESSAYFKGTLDEVALYNGMISGTDVLTHYYLGRGYAESCAAPVSIMPLGNSITRGYGTGDIPTTAPYNFGYRRPLYISMTAASYSFDFVGGLSHGELATGPSFDYDHEGHGGYRADQIATDVASYLTANPAEVILLHIGTNDIAQGQGFSVADITAILDNIDTVSEKTTVILAQIIDQDPSNINYTDVTPFNNNLATLAQNRIANGDKIILVDQQSALNYPTDMFDWLHPNEGGYDKTADVWLEALDDFMPVCITPAITSTPVTDATVDQLYTYNVKASGAPTPTYALLTKPGGMGINAITGLISWTPTSNQLGTNSVEVEATNSFGSDTQLFTVTVSMAPTITSLPVTAATAGQSYTYDVTATGMPTPTYALLTAPTGMTINSVTGVISWTPLAAQVGNHSVEVEAGNAVGTDTQPFTVTVSIAPTITSSPVTKATVGQSYTYTVTVTGTPMPTYTLLTAPTGMTINSVSGIIAWTPLANQVGNHPVEVEASNAVGSDTQAFTVTVSLAPTITSSPVMAVTVGQSYTYTVTATGTPTPTYALLVAPTGMTIDSVTGVIAWTPLANQVGDHSVEVEANNAVGTDTQPFTVEVNVAPTITSSPTITKTIVGQSYTYDVEATGTPTPTYALLIAPTGMTIDPATGIISWIPGIDQIGSHAVSIKANNLAGTDTQVFDVSVEQRLFLPLILSKP